jgi:hypothetical protein
MTLRILTRYAILFISFLVVLSSCNRNNQVDAIKDGCVDSSKAGDFSKCDYIYEPVCGCNNQTYRNACFAKHAGLDSWKVGVCPNQCIDKNIILSDEICTREYQPVCGCDDVTYSNACVARKSGVISYQMGKCDESADR